VRRRVLILVVMENWDGRSQRPTIAKQPVGFWGAAAFQRIHPKSWLVSGGGTYLRPEASNAFTQAVSFGVLFTLAALPSFLFGWPSGRACSDFYARNRPQEYSTWHWEPC
jgi:hypothetical protein